jgi:dephospho-CoA kinase
MSPAEAESRVRAQASDEERLAVADLVIDSSSTIEQTLAQADALWQTLNERSGESA